MSGRRPLLMLLLLAGLWGSAPAFGYVRSRSNGCNPVFWAQTCVYITPSSEFLPDLSASEAMGLMQKAVDSWQNNKPDSFLQLHLLPPNGVREVQFDKVPIIKFRSQSWCRPGECGNKETCYDGSAAAITTVFFIDNPKDTVNDGKILDADIELNAVDNRFYDADNVPPVDPKGRTLTDLWNTLTHEMGHLQGLDHTCRISENDGTPACVVDNHGTRAPICGQVLANQNIDPADKIIADTTMFATAAPMETKKRIPKADDVLGVTEPYPLSQDPKNCQMPTPQDPCATTTTGGHGCAYAAHAKVPLVPAGGVLLLAGALLLRVRRRARQRSM